MGGLARGKSFFQKTLEARRGVFWVCLGGGWGVVDSCFFGEGAGVGCHPHPRIASPGSSPGQAGAGSGLSLKDEDQERRAGGADRAAGVGPAAEIGWG